MIISETASSAVLAAELRGLPCSALPRGAFPSDVKWCRKALKRLGVCTELVPANGGEAVATRIELLPPETRIALLQRRAGVASDAGPNPELWQALGKASKSAREEADLRHRIVLRYHDVLRHGFGKRAALRAVAGETGKSVPTLNRWLAMIDGIPPVDWRPALMPGYKPGGQAAECSPAAWKFFCTDFLRQPPPKLATSYELTALKAQQVGWAWPSIDTIRRKVRREIPETELVLRRQGNKALERLYPPQERDITVLHAMEDVNFDGLEVSVLVEFEDGYVGRPHIFWGQDTYSKMILGAAIDKTENGDLFRTVFGQIVRGPGLMRTATIDNTRAAANKMMTGGVRQRFRWKYRDDEPLGILPRLGVKVIFTTPGHGQSKPIERANREFKTLIEGDLRCAEAYCGDNPRERNGRTPRAMPIAVFRQVVANAIARYNTRPKRNNAVCRRKLSFEQAFRASYEVSPIRKLLPEQLHYLLYACRVVTCGRERGEIFLFENRFHADALLPYRGKQVVVYFDPQAIHSGILVETLDGKRIAEVTRLEKKGYNDTRALRELQRDKRQWLRRKKAEAEARDLYSRADLIAEMPTYGDAAPAAASVVEIVRPVRRATATKKPALAVSPEKKAQFEQNLQANLERMERRAAGM